HVQQRPNSIIESLWNIAKHLPPSDQDDMIDTSIGQIVSMINSAVLVPDFQYVMECVSTWGHDGEFLDLVHQYVSECAGKRSPRRSNQGSIPSASERACVSLYLFNESLVKKKIRE